MHELPGRCRGNASLIGEETAKDPISQSSDSLLWTIPGIDYRDVFHHAD
jgi:hypothetical protein